MCIKCALLQVHQVYVFKLNWLNNFLNPLVHRNLTCSHVFGIYCINIANAENLGILTSTLRFWDTQFEWLRPKYDKKGDRQYTRATKQYAEDIHYLLHVCGMTIKGLHKAHDQGYYNDLIKFFEKKHNRWDTLK